MPQIYFVPSHPLCVAITISSFLFLTPLLFDTPALVLYLSVHFLLLSVHFYPSLLSSSTPVLIAFPVFTLPQLPFVLVCQKRASITGCFCITVTIMQIYLLFKVSKKKKTKTFSESEQISTG